VKYRWTSSPSRSRLGTLVRRSRNAETAQPAPRRSNVAACPDCLNREIGVPLRVAVISDIHGNLHALEAVLDAIAETDVEEIWCLGDLVGYGPRPNRCCTTVRDRTALCLSGNHDLGVLGLIDLSEFSYDAAAAAYWTRDVLEPDARAYLEGLEPSGTAPEVELYHASPRDPVWEYVLTAEAAAEALAATSAPVVLVGHSHVALALLLQGSNVGGGLAPDGTELDLGEARWLLNPGSVGQPRDGDPRAAWLLLDLDAGRASFRRVPYPIERTQQEIRERGLPDALAERLAEGL
jgi:diadenosine tetraphosphatase ApaH/serine/threonine PP2A family protein phosphatase